MPNVWTRKAVRLIAALCRKGTMVLAPTIMTARLTLRALSLADWEAYAAMWADVRVTTYIGGEPRPRDLAWTKFTQSAGLWSLMPYGMWAVIDRANDRFVGVAGLAQFERGIAQLGGLPESGWAFTADSWGRGIATETVAAVVGWADSAGIAETCCMIDVGNIASARVAVRNGYELYDSFDDMAGPRQVFRRRAPAV
jgi:RimJ/RimL family protein N-acetyltransferase